MCMKKDNDFYWKIINVKLSGIKNIENEIKIKDVKSYIFYSVIDWLKDTALDSFKIYIY